MDETTEVTFKGQKVFHDGTSMIVAKATEKRGVPTRFVQGFIDEGVIDKPKGWDAAVAERNIPRADSAGQVDPAADPLDHDGNGKKGGARKPAADGEGQAPA